MASELLRAEDRGNMCSGREAKAAGLRAEYFGRVQWAGPPVLVRMESPIEDAWPQQGVDVLGAVASARWSGWIRPPLSGAYAFHISQGAARVKVAGQWVAGSTAPGQASGWVAGTVHLSAGRYYPIVIELPSVAAGPQSTQALTLQWTAPHGARYVVPKTVL